MMRFLPCSLSGSAFAASAGAGPPSPALARTALFLMRALAERDGLGVLMTTHHPDHAFLVADEAAVLHAGSLDGPAPPREIVTAERLRAAYRVDTAIGRLALGDAERWVCVPLLE